MKSKNEASRISNQRPQVHKFIGNPRQLSTLLAPLGRGFV